MWQTKYALAVPKNLGVEVDLRQYSEDDFLEVSTLLKSFHTDTLQFC